MKHNFYFSLKFIFVLTFSTLASGLCLASDTIPPVINLRTSETIYVAKGSVYISVMPTATDNVSDSSKIIIKKTFSDVDVSFTGIYSEKFTATDESNNTSTKTRIVIVSKDLTPPVIKLLGPDTVFHKRGVPYVSNGVTATDNMDGNVTNAVVKIFSDVNVNVNGLYKEIFKATDVAGNSAEKTQYVKVGDEGSTNFVAMVKASLISVSPNPAKDIIRINIGHNSGNMKLSMISMDGKTILESDIYINNSPVSVGHLKPGIYFVMLQDDLKNYYGKVVIDY